MTHFHFASIVLLLAFATGLRAAEVDVFDQSSVKLEVDTDDPKAIKIILIAGPATVTKAPGGHEYFAGCVLLADLLKQTPGVHPVLVRDWPKNEKIFDGAKVVLFYMDGGGKQSSLASKDRIAKLDALAAAGTGMVHLHGSVDYPGATAENARAWLGGVWLAGYSNAGRGHWDTSHDEFPSHPITRGVTPWKLNDGWLCKMKFVDGMKGITPLVWSSKAHGGSSKGGNEAVAGWAYERPATDKRDAALPNRSFVFTGIDAHSAWALPGMRQFVVNGVLWSAGVEVPEAGAKCELDVKTMNRCFDKRPAKPAVKVKTKEK